MSSCLVIRAGSASDPPGKEGLAALTADMLDEGAGRRGPLDIAEEIDFLGAELSVEAQKEHIAVSMEVLKRNLDPALDIFADVVLRPAFEPKEWERVKALALNDLAQRREEPREVARLTAERVFYGDTHPYGHPVDGYEASVKAIGLEDIRGFYRSQVLADRAVFLAAGDITLAELRKEVEGRFAAWTEGAAPRPLEPKPSAAPRKAGPAAPSLEPEPSTPFAPTGASRLVIVDKPDAPQTEVRVLVPGPEFASPEIAPLLLANTVLGGTFTSRLVTNLRERNGFTYGASSVVALRSLRAHVVAGSAVYRDKTVPALVEICRELRAMEAGKLEPGELEKARSTQRSRLIEALEAQDSTLGLFVLSAALGYSPGERRDFYERLGATTDEDIARESREGYRWDRATIVLVGDRSAIEAQLAEVRAKPPAGLGGKPFALPTPELRGRDGEKLGTAPTSSGGK